MSNNSTTIYFLIFIAILFVITFRFFQIDHTQTMEWGYVNSGAINPYYGTNPPLGYRPLIPVLLNCMGYIPKAGDVFLPVISATVMCMIFFFFLMTHGFEKWEAAMGCLFLAVSPGIPDLLKEFCINHVDTASHILILFAFISIIKQNHILFSIATLLGTFNREWALVLIPAWYLYHFGFSLSKKSFGLLLRISLPSLVVYWMVRNVYFPNTAIGVMTQNLGIVSAVSEVSVFQYYWNEFTDGGFITFLNRVFSFEFFQFGMLALLPVFITSYKFMDKKWLWLSGYYALVCVMQFLIAADVWRLSFYLFPVLITAYINWLGQIHNNYGRKTQIYCFAIITFLFTVIPDSMLPLVIMSLLVLADSIYQYRKMV